MQLNSTFFKDDSSLKFFYCSLNNKEYILLGDKQGNIFSTDKCLPAGKVIMDILDNSEEICNTILHYYQLIDNECTPDSDVDTVSSYLTLLNSELFNINDKYFFYFDIKQYIFNKYVEKFSQLDIRKAQLENNNQQLVSLEKTTNGLIENKDEFDKLISDSKKLLEKRKQELVSYENITFKDFVLMYLQNLLFDWDLFESILFFEYSDVINSSNTKNAQQFQLDYNTGYFNIANNVKCYLKLCSINDDNINFNFKPEENNNPKLKIIKVFQFDNIIELLNLSLSTAIENGITIKVCDNCYKFFIPASRTDEKYCNRPSPQNSKRTCKEYGANKTYREEIKSIPIKNEHNKTSQFFRMRINRAKDSKEKTYYENKFNKYKDLYLKQKKKYNAGKLSEKEFINWMLERKEEVKDGNPRNSKKQEV